LSILILVFLRVIVLLFKKSREAKKINGNVYGDKNHAFFIDIYHFIEQVSKKRLYWYRESIRRSFVRNILSKIIVKFLRNKKAHCEILCNCDFRFNKGINLLDLSKGTPTLIETWLFLPTWRAFMREATSTVARRALTTIPRAAYCVAVNRAPVLWPFCASARAWSRTSCVETVQLSVYRWIQN
jgi:hypothetical protein